MLNGLSHKNLLGFKKMYPGYLPSVLWCCWLGDRKSIRPVTIEWCGVGVVICLERGADLHTGQLMPLPLSISCFSEIQTGFTFLVPAHPGSPGQRAVKRVCCVCMLDISWNWLGWICRHRVVWLFAGRDIDEASDGRRCSCTAAAAQGRFSSGQPRERDKMLVFSWDAGTATAQDLPNIHSCKRLASI